MEQLRMFFSNVLDYSTVCFDLLSRLDKDASSYQGENYIENDLKGKENWFELSMVRVTEGKITVNVSQKYRGNRLWFELSGVDCKMIFIPNPTNTNSNQMNHNSKWPNYFWSSKNLKFLNMPF